MKDQTFDTILLDLFVNGDLGMDINKVFKSKRIRFIKSQLTQYCKSNADNKKLLKYVKEEDIDAYIGRLKLRWKAKEY